MKELELDNLIGTVVLKCEADGLCQPCKLVTEHTTAEFSRVGNVREWQGFDGDDVQWYRIPGHTWEFCLPANVVFCESCLGASEYRVATTRSVVRQFSGYELCEKCAREYDSRTPQATK